MGDAGSRWKGEKEALNQIDAFRLENIFLDNLQQEPLGWAIQKPSGEIWEWI